MNSDSVIIIPTYNEKENIEAIIRAINDLEKKFDILVIDDGSPDGTATIVKGLMEDEFAGKLHIIERSGKLGLGTAYITGFKWAIEQKYDYIFEMDADFNVKDSFGMNEAQNVDGIVRQTLETDGEYIYSVFYKPNSVYKYSVDGEFIGKCTLPIAENEAENIFFIGDSIYVSYNILGAANGGEIYKLENPVFEK